MSQTLVPTLSLFLLQKTKYVYVPPTPQCSTSHSCAYSSECSSKLSPCLSTLDEKCITTCKNENKLRTLTYSVITDMNFSDCQNNAETLSLFFHLLEQPFMIRFCFLSDTKQSWARHWLGVLDFLLAGGRDDDLWPEGELNRLGLCWSLPFSGDLFATKEGSTNPTVWRRVDGSNEKKKKVLLLINLFQHKNSQIFPWTELFIPHINVICAVLLKSLFLLRTWNSCST